MIHVSAVWVNNTVGMIAEYRADITKIKAPFLICVYNSIVKFAVPCFLMLSGAFIIDNKKNDEYRNFYSKSFVHIGVPTIIFSGIYFLYRLPPCFIGEDRGINPLLKDIIKDSPMYHMWYLYMLIGVMPLHRL